MNLPLDLEIQYLVNMKNKRHKLNQFKYLLDLKLNYYFKIYMMNIHN